jgi:rod shape-determining protein MreC
MVLPHRSTDSLNSLFNKVFSPILKVGKFSFNKAFKAVPSSEDFVSRGEYNRLLAAYDNIYADLRKEHKRYERLAGIRTSRPKEGPAIVLTEVINTRTTASARQLFVNEGQAGGLRAGQYVLGENAIIGTVNSTQQNTAWIRLVTDANHNIPVWIWRPGNDKYVQGWMNGTGTEVCKIPLISTEYDIKEGDTVYAAARIGYLETARVIGKVTIVKPDENKPLIWEITVVPIIHGEDLTDVAVIVMDPDIIAEGQ